VSDRACTRCGDRLAVLTAYWGDPLCSPCAQELARWFEEQGRWPPVPWELDELARLDSRDTG
jgi:hypothetical protein